MGRAASKNDPLTTTAVPGRLLHTSTACGKVISPWTGVGQPMNLSVHGHPAHHTRTSITDCLPDCLLQFLPRRLQTYSRLQTYRAKWWFTRL